jgi:hypothetical protein
MAAGSDGPNDLDILPLELQSLLALWRSKCGEGRLPRERDFKAAELAPFRAHLVTVGIAGPGRFRIGPAHGVLIRRFGREASGLALETLARDIAAGLARTLGRAAAASAPVAARAEIPLGRASSRHADLVPPLADDSGHVAALFFASVETKT